MSTGNMLIEAILDSPIDNAPRLIYADYLEENGEDNLARDIRLEQIYHISVDVDVDVGNNFGDGGGYGNGDGGGYGNGDGGGYGNGGYGNGDDGSGYGDGGGFGGNGFGDGGNGFGGNGSGYGNSSGYKQKRDVKLMKNGLYILSIPSGYYPYVLIGWVHVDGLNLHVYNGRIIRRFGNMQALANIAKNGPANDTQLLDPSEQEEIWRPCVSRAIKASVNNWEKHCPKPQEFVI